MKKTILVLACCILAFSATACRNNPKLKNGEEVVASIDGKQFTADALYKELKGNYGQDLLLTMIDRWIADKEVKTDAEAEAYAQYVVEYYKQFAAQYQMEFVEFLATMTSFRDEKHLYDEALVEYKVSAMVAKQIATTFTDKDIQKYYDENYSERLTVRHILIEPEEGSRTDAEALKLANELLAELNKVDKDDFVDKFAELAKEYSDCGSYSNGGLLDEFMINAMVKPFWDASLKLKNGEYTSAPIKTEHGYHIIYRVSSREKPTLDESKEAIRTTMAEALLEEDENAKSLALDEIRKRYNFNIHDTDLKNQYNQFINNLKETQ